jgi:ribosomal-protein-alanine N-acetyltransferase
VVRWTDVPGEYPEEEARSWFRRTEAERAAGRGVYLAVVDAQGGELLGACDVRVLDYDPGVGELGFFLGSHARGRGIMTRAVGLISRWTFEALGVARVQLLAHPDNEPSIRVAERAGFAREGLLRLYRVKGGGREDRIVFAILPEDLA